MHAGGLEPHTRLPCVHANGAAAGGGGRRRSPGMLVRTIQNPDSRRSISRTTPAPGGGGLIELRHAWHARRQQGLGAQPATTRISAASSPLSCSPARPPLGRNAVALDQTGRPPPGRTRQAARDLERGRHGGECDEEPAEHQARAQQGEAVDKEGAGAVGEAGGEVHQDCGRGAQSRGGHVSACGPGPGCGGEAAGPAQRPARPAQQAGAQD